jgi:uncharacterized protein YegP (UPF0339 family)
MDGNQGSQAAQQVLQVYKRADGKHAWRLEVNGEIVATDGGQGYENAGDALKMGIQTVSGHYSGAQIRVGTSSSDPGTPVGIVGQPVGSAIMKEAVSDDTVVKPGGDGE